MYRLKYQIVLYYTMYNAHCTLSLPVANRSMFIINYCLFKRDTVLPLYTSFSNYKLNMKYTTF